MPALNAGETVWVSKSYRRGVTPGETSHSAMKYLQRKRFSSPANTSQFRDNWDSVFGDSNERKAASDLGLTVGETTPIQTAHDHPKPQG